MRQITFLALVCLATTVVGQSVDDFWAEDWSNVDDIFIQDWFHKTNVKCGTRPQASSDDYQHGSRSVHRETSDGRRQVKWHEDKIVGGTESWPGEIPWQARVKIYSGNEPSNYDCGAVIINEFWLLSAAHCYYGRSKWNRWIKVGEHHLMREDPGEQMLQVDRIFKHTKYNHTSKDYDIALIRVKPSHAGRGIQFNNFVQPICLPDPSTALDVDDQLIVSGWGWTQPCVNCTPGTQDLSDVLVKADIFPIDQDLCRRLYIGKKFPRITDRMLCAGYINGSIDACKSDSGGPLVYETRGYSLLYGIVSWGGDCAQPNYPGVYARVPALVPWILDTIKQRSINPRQSVIPAKPE